VELARWGGQGLATWPTVWGQMTIALTPSGHLPIEPALPHPKKLRNPHRR